ncbi:mCG147456 [Mus musculus]|jgi:hypothetical protein|uniref:Uncharacterized protein n=1 Tax=Mus musculus TaxID=10090 RepID=Q8C7M9_MOUSE|nr:mCG147456 [Mus musculus]BAC33962.1 unnamed protein product [Mus musculus]
MGDVSHTLKAQGSIPESGQGGWKSQKWQMDPEETEVSRLPTRRCTYELTETVKCIRPAQAQARQKSQCVEGKVDINSHPSPRGYLQLILAGKGTSAFFNGVTSGVSNTLKSLELRKSWPSQI